MNYTKKLASIVLCLVALQAPVYAMKRSRDREGTQTSLPPRKQPATLGGLETMLGALGVKEISLEDKLKQYSAWAACSRKLLQERAVVQLEQLLALHPDHPEVLYCCSELYNYGYGIQKDARKAFDLLSKAAQYGHVKAQNNLGLLYEDGDCVAKNEERAVELYRAAAEKNYNRAQYNLGLMYYFGRGIKQDFFEAAKWFEKAAIQGHPQSQCNLGLMYQKGLGVTQSDVRASLWFIQSANQHVPRAQCYLGLMYENALGGLKQNYAEAKRLYSDALRRGFNDAEEHLKRLSEKYPLEDALQDLSLLE